MIARSWLPVSCAGAPKPAQPGPTRTSSTDAKTEVTRILAAKTHYAVLEVEHSADEDTVKRAKKTKSLLVHPDKAGNLAGAGDAFGKVIDVSTSCELTGCWWYGGACKGYV